MANEKQLDLIARKALLKTLDLYINPMPNESGYEFLRGIATAITEIEGSPAVDAMEVVHGRWEYGRWEQGRWVKGNERCRCSVCHRDFAVDNLNVWHGCPQCLAKMDGGNEDGVDD